MGGLVVADGDELAEEASLEVFRAVGVDPHGRGHVDQHPVGHEIAGFLEVQAGEDDDLAENLDSFADDIRESLSELAAEAGVELTAEEAPSGQAVRA